MERGEGQWRVASGGEGIHLGLYLVLDPCPLLVRSLRCIFAARAVSLTYFPMKLSWLFVILLLIFVAVFSVQNAGVITVHFLSWEIEISAALVIQLAALLGGVVGLICGAWSRRSSRAAEKQAASEPVRNVTPSRPELPPPTVGGQSLTFERDELTEDSPDYSSPPPTEKKPGLP